MAWHSKVLWSEGLFLRPQHLQQSDRYVEHLVEARTRLASPYPWGFAELSIDTDLAQQSMFALRSATGIMPDGTPFNIPTDTIAPPLVVPEDAAGQLVWLTMPSITAGAHEVGEREAERATRYYAKSELVPDASRSVPQEEDVDLALPRLEYELRRARKEGFAVLPIARITEVRDKTIVFEERFVPPVLTLAAHPQALGWVDRSIGWIETKLEELSRYAADPGSGGGLQSADYLVLQLLNRAMPLMRHLRASRYTHPERAYGELLRLVGELATFSTPERRAKQYPAYDHDDLEATFGPVVRDLQAFLSARLSRRAIRLDLIERASNAFISTIRDRALFRDATFVLEVSARRPLTENPDAVSAALQARAEHQDETTSCTPTCPACRSSTCRRHRRRSGRSPTTSTSRSTSSRRFGRSSARPLRWACTSPATGRSSSSSSGPCWRRDTDGSGQRRCRAGAARAGAAASGAAPRR